MLKLSSLRLALSTTDVDLTGGVERVVVECANRLSGAGHEVIIVAARVDASVLAPSVRVRRIPMPGDLDAKTGLGFRTRATRALAQLQPDAHGAFSVLSPPGGVFWTPSVHRVGYELLRSRRGAAGRLALRLHPYHAVRLRLERTMLKSGGYALVVAQSESMKADVIAAYELPPEDVEVLPYGYDDSAFNVDLRHAHREATRERLGYRKNERVVLFVANELERKGWDTLLSAVHLSGNSALRVLGAGRVAPTSPPPWVQWLGPNQDVAPLYAAADAFVLPTRYEPWGLVIVEALASGLPVVTSRLAGAAAAVREGDTGRLLDDPDDARALAGAIDWAVSDRTADAPDIAASVSAYTWASTAEQYTRILERVAGG